jgi:hypothetical protein
MMGYNNFLNGALFGTGMSVGGLFVPLMLWSLAWKGWALWRASKNDSKVWFVVLLVLNTVGILEILYLFVFGKENSSPKKTKK